jgi:hypothetical protein
VIFNKTERIKIIAASGGRISIRAAVRRANKARKVGAQQEKAA